MSDPQNVSKKSIIDYLTSVMAASAKPDSKLVERVAIALGNLSLGENSDAVKRDILKSLFSVGTNASEEVHFTVGEALSCVGLGWRSKAAADPTVDEEMMEYSQEEAPLLSELLLELMKTHLPNPKTRSASAVWLLSIVKYCGKHSVVQAELPTIQQLFSFLLSDPNEVVQEVAARGLVHVHEFGDDSMKKNLVQNLLETLSSGKKSEFKLQGESMIFPEGSLGKGSLGKDKDESNLTTYKELVSLASDVGQPDLVYKFLSLSSHHALWNSRKGAAFAATSIVSNSDEQLLSNYLPTLVPKLYRYSFDPNLRIAASMKNILKALAPKGDVKKLENLYFHQIMKELLEGLNSNLWRSREGASFAVADILQGRDFDDLKEYLEELWLRIFRVLDDVKESVRKAANLSLKTLSGLTSRFCDPQYTAPAKGQEAVYIALTFLLKKGLVNAAEEVRSFSLSQIQKIAKVAGFLLRPHVPELVGILLEGLSAMESPQLNYMSFHTESMNVSTEQLEEARIAISKMTPMNDTLELCTKQVDTSNIEPLVRKLVEVIKTGVGLPTRVGCAKFITQLTFYKSEELKPHSDKLLLVLLTPLKDKSPSVRKNFASALANVAQLASKKAIKQLVDRLKELYADSENDENRSTCAVAFYELVKRAPAAMRDFYPDILPLIYGARHDPSEEVAKMFKDVWAECSIGGLRSYIPNIISFVETSMNAQTWILKKQAGLTVKELADSAGEDLSDYADALIKMLLSNLPGRLWKGKEALLNATAAVCAAGPERIDPAAVVEALLKECKRNDKEYKRQAMMALSSVLQTFKRNAKLFELVKEPLFGLANEEEKADSDDPKEKPLVFLIRSVAFQALANAWPADLAFQTKYAEEFTKLLAESYLKNIWTVRVQILEAGLAFLKAIPASDDALKVVLTTEVLKNILSICFEGMSDAKYTALRTPALDLLSELILRCKGTGLLSFSTAIPEKLSLVTSLDPTLRERVEKISQML
eukprot:TRINITY_DN1633_c0_g5_i1.p1 TRINITY_DN1633_c0_g5~~TRINITY_DN1633_c0_g5_i1.p1  ORF type:complete len:992 (-),score=360.72 TRINITY_DN1633_c0_g5_i1:43-3018(-)